ncbi:MAG: HD domain-containing protein [Myxococcales bacterium]|nr:HD domain-containing protein [Myxococcales bacterium]
MAKAESTLGNDPKLEEARLRARRRRLLLLCAVAASLVLAAILTLQVSNGGPVPIGASIQQPGEIAERSYKAPNEVTLVDRQATEEVRRAALEQASIVYDFDAGRALELRGRLGDAFAAARAALEKEAPEGGEAEAAIDPGEAFVAALGEEVEVSARGLAVLGKSDFREQDERGLVALVVPVVARMIVGDPQELARHGASRTVLVRELGAEDEQRLLDSEAVLSQPEAVAQLRGQAASVLEGRPRRERKALVAIAEGMLRPNLQINLRATDERRQAAADGVKEVTITLRKGEIIARDGDPLTERHVWILKGIQDQARTTNQLAGFIAVALLIFIVVSVLWRFASHGIESFPRGIKDAGFLLSVLIVTALGTRLGLFLCEAVGNSRDLAPLFPDTPEPLYYVIPVAAATMLVRTIHSAETAAVFAVAASMLAGLQMANELSYALFVLVGSLTAAVGVARVTQRGTLLRAGVRVGVANALVVAALELLEAQGAPVRFLTAVSLSLVGGALSGVVVAGVTPLVEGIFSYTTDVKLLELSNRDQPLLRELEMRAPGTYHHSMMVGHLAERAAEIIGANAILCKVAGYYHDIGKMRRPHFFVENVTIHGGENRHEKLAPSISAKIIKAHVKDGLEYGRENKLSGPIMSGIAQHHGTSVIRFFYEKAKEQSDQDKEGLVQEHDYRYPGPRPQTCEAGILMLADSVEAASRTLTDATPARIQQLVQRITNNYFRDGQLNECNLTLRDLNAIARSFIETLSAIKHARIDYPDPTDPGGRRLEETEGEGVVEQRSPREKERSERPAKVRDDDLKRLGLP